jgi:uncharacterized protein YjaG (DUF416 family)
MKETPTAAESQAAGRLMQDPAFQATAEHVEETYTMKWKISRSLEEREDAWYRLQALYDVLRALRDTYEHGLAAEAVSARKERLAML